MRFHPIAELLTLVEAYDLHSPEILLEGDGAVGVDWDEGARASISCSLCEDGRVFWSVLVGTYTAHGQFTLPAVTLPDALRSGFIQLAAVNARAALNA